MISSIKQSIANKLLEIYPEISIYEDDVPEQFKTPSFLITLVKQDYKKMLNNRFKSSLSFDISYLSNKDKAEIKDDCLEVQLSLFRNFDLIDTFRILNKQSNVKEYILHFIFEINYSEMIENLEEKITKYETNTNLREE